MQDDAARHGQRGRWSGAWAGDVRFLAMNADNLYPVDALRDLVALEGPGLPAFELRGSDRVEQHPGRARAIFAPLDVDAEGYLTGIVEKPSIWIFRLKAEATRVEIAIFRLRTEATGALLIRQTMWLPPSGGSQR